MSEQLYKKKNGNENSKQETLENSKKEIPNELLDDNDLKNISGGTFNLHSSALFKHTDNNNK